MADNPINTIAENAPETAGLLVAGQLLIKLVARPLEEMGELAADVVKGWRFQIQTHNYIKLMEATHKKLANEGINPKPVPAKVLFSLIDTATLEEDITLQDMWSSLLANAADPHNTLKLDGTFVEIAKQLSPQDAKLLELIYSKQTFEHLKNQTAGEEKIWIAKELLVAVLENTNDYEVLAENLHRLRLVEGAAYWGGGNSTHEKLKHTTLGLHFFKACTKGTVNI